MLALVFTAAKPEKFVKKNNELLFANPIILKMISGGFHNILADKLWLLSNTVSEMKHDSEDVNVTEFYEASMGIAIMDPYFYSANSYPISYFVSIANDLNSSLELIRFTRKIDSENFLLYFNELSLILNYGTDLGYKVDYEKIRKLIYKMETIENKSTYIGIYNVYDWAEDFIVYYSDKANRHDEKIKDLQWLLKNTKDENRKRLIEARIKEFSKK